MNVVFKLAAGILAMYGTAYAIRSSSVNLKHFKPSEFGLWWPLMDINLLLGLDEFRAMLGQSVQISPAFGSLGRPGQGNEGSQHFPSPFVMAADVMIPESVPLSRAYQVARSVGFHGIGLYPDWKPRHGLHLDMRKDRTPGNPAMWSAFNVAGKQTYTAITKAIG